MRARSRTTRTRAGLARAGLARTRLTRGGVAAALVVATLFSGTAAVAAFTASTANPTNTVSAAATFPTYPAAVTADGPQFQHRADEAVSPAATPSASDTSGNNRTGTYAGSTDGPSTWWRFDDASGGTAADASGAANPATLTGNAGWGNGLSRGGLTLDGSGDQATGTRGAVRTDESFTASVWVYLTNGTAYRTALSQFGATSSGFFLQYSEYAGNRWRFSMPHGDGVWPGVDEAISASTATLNTWTHLTAVHDDPADQMRLYVNGALEATATHSIEFSATGALVAGRGFWNGGPVDDVQGRLDEVRTWRRALSPAEVAEVAQGPTTAYDLDETGGATAADSSGYGNTGTLHNGAGWSTAGRSGGALSLDGVDDHVTAAGPALGTNDSFSVAAWAYLTATPGYSNAVVTQAGAISSGFVLHRDASSGKWIFKIFASDVVNPTSMNATAATTAVANSWVHLTGVYDDARDEVRIYVNGRLDGRATALNDYTATGPLTIGRELLNGNHIDYFPGRIDDVRTYGRPLSGTEVESLYRAPAVRWTFDERAGSATVGDYSGNDRLGTPTNGAGWSTDGHSGNAGTFDGTDDHVTGPNAPIRTDTSFTVSAWAYLTAKPGGNRTVLSQDGSSISGYFLQFGSGGDRWGFWLPSADSTAAGGPYVASSASPALNRWTHLVGVFDDDTDQARLYVNGVLQGTGTHTTDWHATGAMAVGRSRWNGVNGDHFPGRIDEVAAYQRALTDADVTALYHTSPSLRWDFTENTGTTTADSSANANTGSLNGGTTWTGSGHTGTAVGFDGTDDRVIGTTAAIRTDASYTVAAWAYLSATGTHRTVLSQDGTNISGFMLKYQPVPNRWQFFTTNVDSTNPVYSYVESSAPPTLNAWVHLAAVYDDEADQIRLYVNGVLQGTAGHTTDWNAGGVFAAGRGRWNGTNSDPFAGYIDEVTAYTRALDAAAVAHLYTATRPVPVPTRADPAEASARLPGALQGPQQGQQNSTAIAYRGISNGYNPTQYTNPTAFTVECWFRVTGNRGGSLIGFNSAHSGIASSFDRHVYVDSGGRLTYGVHPGAVRTVRSPGAVNDGNWHHMAATLGADGMKLYLDGELVASNATVTNGGNYTGYWRWGGSTLDSWPDQPATDYLTGTLDEIAVYHTQLTDQQIRRHYHANH